MIWTSFSGEKHRTELHGIYYCFHYEVYFNMFFWVYLAFQAIHHKPSWNDAGDFYVSTSKWPFVIFLFCFVNLRGNKLWESKNEIIGNSCKCFTSLLLSHFPTQWKIGKNKCVTKTRWHSWKLWWLFICCAF